MKIKTITSKWLENNGRRLDCGPYMSGAIEARMLIKKLYFEPLSDLTHGFSGGIFKAPRLSPNYVSDPDHGCPYLSSTDILCCDLSFVPLIANSQAKGLEDYFVEKGMTLVTSSGDTGRTAFARNDMHGMMGSPHFMRIKPDENKIAPGYLFAFLTSKYGNRLMVSGTYGSIIQAIEPHHISDLPVPRIDDVEQEAHRLVISAADLRYRSNQLLERAIDMLLEKSGLPALTGAIPSRFDVNVVPSSSVLSRLDGLFHSRFHVEVVDAIKSSKNGGVNV
jgi:type I restriction enzyme S subunit